MKKQIACRIFVTLLVAVILLAGCKTAPGPESGASGVDGTVPGQERTLRLFSLYRDEALAGAADLFEKMNEGVRVEYEFYEVEELQGEGAVDDVVRRINTEMLNGTGPDVFVIDYLPLQTYLHQGSLLDLSQGVDTSDFYPTFAQPLTEGGTFVIPLTAQLPVVIGKDGAVDNADAQISAIMQGVKIDPQELRRLWEWDGTGDAPTPLNERAGMLFMSISAIYNDLWASMSEQFIVDNVLQKDAISLLLQKMQEFYDVLEFDPEYYYYGMGSSRNPALQSPQGDWHYIGLNGNDSTYPMLWGMADYALDSIDNVDTLAVYFAPEKFADSTPLGDITVVPSRGMGVSAWQPSNMLAVPASSAEPELAQRFIQHCLSPEVQTLRLEYGGFSFYGIPVTRTVMQKQIDAIVDIMNECELGFDGEAFKRWVEELISKYETPEQLFGGTVDFKGIVYEAAIALYEGKTTLDAAVNGIEAEMQTYLRELL